MSFSEFKGLSETLKAFEVVYTEANFIEEVPFAVSDYFRQDLQLMMDEAVVDNSEYAICENLVYPILKEVWKQYRRNFILWSHEFLNCDAQLSGFPEYILARRSRSVSLGTIAPGQNRLRQTLFCSGGSQAR